MYFFSISGSCLSYGHSCWGGELKICSLFTKYDELISTHAFPCVVVAANPVVFMLILYSNPTNPCIAHGKRSDPSINGGNNGHIRPVDTQSLQGTLSNRWALVKIIPDKVRDLLL